MGLRSLAWIEPSVLADPLTPLGPAPGWTGAVFSYLAMTAGLVVVLWHSRRVEPPWQAALGGGLAVMLVLNLSSYYWAFVALYAVAAAGQLRSEILLVLAATLTNLFARWVWMGLSLRYLTLSLILAVCCFLALAWAKTSDPAAARPRSSN